MRPSTLSRQHSGVINFIDISIQEIEAFDSTSLYLVKEKVQKWKGFMYNLRNRWLLTTDWVKHYASFISNFTNETQIFIEDAKLSAIVNHMARKMADRLNEDGGLFGANQVHGYANQVEGVYAKFGKTWHVYNKEKANITSGFDWKTPRQKLRFLFEIFGYFVFEESMSKEMQVKVVYKILQVQNHIVPEKGEEANEYMNENNVCLF